MNLDEIKAGLIYQDPETKEWKIWTSELLGYPSNPAPELHIIVNGLFDLKHKIMKEIK